ncbi:MAG: alpha/beta hydrolase-fold protein [Candidatus Omnitrophota bacterium]
MIIFRKIIILIGVLIIISFPCFVSAQTLILKSGKSIDGKILEDTKDYVKIETSEGHVLYFYKNTIESIKVAGNTEDCAIPIQTRAYKTGMLDYLDEGYMLYVQKGIAENLPVSILICLPGWGISAKQDINNWAFHAAKKGFITVGLDINYEILRSEADVSRLYSKIANIISSLEKEYPIKKGAVVIAGTSAGAMMSLSLCLRYPDKFNAIAVVSGARFNFGAERYLRNAKGLWLYLVHGQSDKSVPINDFNSTRKKLEQNGALIESKVIPGGGHTLSSSVYKDVVEWLSKAK